MLAEGRLEKFQEAVGYEKELEGSRRYTWSQGETLLEFIPRREQIIAEHQKYIEQQRKAATNRTLVNVLSDVLDSEDETAPCVACHY